MDNSILLLYGICVTHSRYVSYIGGNGMMHAYARACV
jgi:hypothetical protein